MICIKASKNVSSFISERCYCRGVGTPWDVWDKSQLFLVILKYFLTLILWIFTNENDDQRKKISQKLFVPKGQYNSKANGEAVNSSKKGMNEFDFTTYVT